MRDEYDFSKGERGKFHIKPGTRVQLPAHVTVDLLEVIKEEVDDYKQYGEGAKRITLHPWTWTSITPEGHELELFGVPVVLDGSLKLRCFRVDE